MKVVGYLDISSNLFWKKSVLGKIYNINIGNKEYQLHFPKLSEKITTSSHNYSLVSPSIISELGVSDNDKNYGDIIDSSDFDCTINYVVITGDVSNDNEIGDIYNIIDKWVHLFLSILKLSGDIIRQENMIRYKSNYLDLFVQKRKKYGRPKNGNEATLIINVKIDAISQPQLIKAIELLNKGIEIPIEYEYYLKGVDFFEKKNYRNCVLECATAAEMAVSNRIEYNLKKIGVKDYKSFLNEDQSGLESKFKKLIYFNDKQNLDISRICTPRNHAIHAGTEVEKNEAKECLHITKLLLDKFNKFY